MRTRTSPKNQDRLFAALFKPNATPVKKVDKRKPCAWIPDDDGVWQTNCGQAFCPTGGAPAENGSGFRYCPYCGRMLDAWGKT